MTDLGSSFISARRIFPSFSALSANFSSSSTYNGKFFGLGQQLNEEDFKSFRRKRGK
jgi:hypothetical protein